MSGKNAPIPARQSKHGAWSRHTRRRYTDQRTREGRQLKVILDDLVADLGDHENLTAGQRLLLDTLQSKLIVVLQIAKYVDQQPEIIKDGQLIPCLSKNYLAYLNSIRLTLSELYKDYGQSTTKVPTIQEIILEHENRS